MILVPLNQRQKYIHSIFKIGLFLFNIFNYFLAFLYFIHNIFFFFTSGKTKDVHIWAKEEELMKLK
jgi:hypothetical protein